MSTVIFHFLKIISDIYHNAFLCKKLKSLPVPRKARRVRMRRRNRPDKTAPRPKAAKPTAAHKAVHAAALRQAAVNPRNPSHCEKRAALDCERLSPGCAYFPHTIHILNSHIVFKQGATFWENALTLRPVHDTIGVRR